MKGIVVERVEDRNVLKIKDFPIPVPGKNQILVKVRATSLNRIDVLQCQNRFSLEKSMSPILGLDISGVVEKTGSKNSKWKIGDRVFGLVKCGGYAEYAVIDQDMAMLIPKNMSFEYAAAIPEVFLVAYQVLFWLGELILGQSVLIHAGASGLGTSAIQLSKVYGLNVIATSSLERKFGECYELGADIVLNYHVPFAEKVLEYTGDKGVDVILDCIGVRYWHENIRSLAVDGRIILLVLDDIEIEKFNPRILLEKRLRVIGTMLRTRDDNYRIKLTREFAKNILPKFVDGEIRPIIDKIYDWINIEEAYRYLEMRRNIGKIVLKM